MTSAGTNKMPPPMPTTPETIPTSSPISSIIQVMRSSSRLADMDIRAGASSVNDEAPSLAGRHLPDTSPA
jgi:hypothetical protein